MSAASWGLVVPVKGDPVTPFRTPFIGLAESIGTALDVLQSQSFARYARRSDLPSTGNMKNQHATVYADPTSANNGDYYWNGTAWVTIGMFGEAVGQSTYSSAIAQNTSASVNITFPSGRFTLAPRLVVTTGNSRITAGTENITAAGAKINLSNWSSGNSNTGFTFDWHATQATASSANG